MRAVCLGGGPGGLYFAISLKRRDPAHEVVVIERNRPDDTFGWGVVLSDETLANLEAKHHGSNESEYLREACSRCEDLKWADCSKEKLRAEVERLDQLSLAQVNAK